MAERNGSGSHDTASGHNSNGGAGAPPTMNPVVVKAEEVDGLQQQQQAWMQPQLNPYMAPQNVMFQPARNRGFSRAPMHPICQVPGCCKDLSGSRGYHQRYKICDDHFRVSSMELDGVVVRFCQQCGKFQPLTDFHDDRRSCTIQLALHAGRRRKRHAAARAAKVNDTVKTHTVGSDSDSGASNGRNAGGNSDGRHVRTRMENQPSMAAANNHNVSTGGAQAGADRGHSLTGLTEEEVRLLRGIIRGHGFREAASMAAAAAAAAAAAMPLGVSANMTPRTATANAGLANVIANAVTGVTSSRTTSAGQDPSAGAGAGAGAPAGTPQTLLGPRPMMYMEDVPPVSAGVMDMSTDQQWLRATTLMSGRRHQDSIDSAQTGSGHPGGMVAVASHQVSSLPVAPGIMLGGAGAGGHMMAVQSGGGARLLVQQRGNSGGGGSGMAVVEEVYQVRDQDQSHLDQHNSHHHQQSPLGKPSLASRGSGEDGAERLELVEVEEPHSAMPPPAPQMMFGGSQVVVGPDGSLVQLVDMAPYQGGYTNRDLYGNQAFHSNGYPALVLDQAGVPQQHHISMQPQQVVYGAPGGGWGGEMRPVGNGQWAAAPQGKMQYVPWNGAPMHYQPQQPQLPVRVVDVQQLHAGNGQQFMPAAGTGNVAQFSGMQVLPTPSAPGVGPGSRVTYLPAGAPVPAPGGLDGRSSADYSIVAPGGVAPPAGNGGYLLITPEQLQELVRGVAVQNQQGGAPATAAIQG